MDLELSVVILLVNLVSRVESSGSPLGYCYRLCKLISLGQKIHLYTATLELISREGLLQKQVN